MSELVYKLLDRVEWEAIEADFEWRGSAVDLEDGFVHFSSSDQVAETARRHFAGRADLVLLGISVAKVELTWEPSRGGALFPHLYGPLPLSAVVQVFPVPLRRGVHEFPELL